MSNKNALIVLGVAMVVLGAGLYWNQGRGDSVTLVNSFEECANAGYPVGESYPRQCWTPEGQNFVEELEGEDVENEEVGNGEPALPNQVTVRGTISCLPKVGSGPQTLECAIGLKAQDGKYYGLKNLFEHDPEYQFSATDTRVEVSGSLSGEEMRGPDGNRYDTAGVISVTSIKRAN